MSPNKQRKQLSDKERRKLKRRLKWAANREEKNKARREEYAARRDKVNKARREDHAANPERRNAASRARYACNSDAVNEARRQCYASNSDAINEARRTNHAADPEMRNAASRAHYARNSDAINEARRTNHAANPDTRNAANRALYAANNDAINEMRRSTRAANTRQTMEGLSNNAATFSTKKITDGTNFDNHQNNVETAVMLFHHNSGLTRFSSLEDLQSDDETIRSTAREELLKEISTQKLSWQKKKTFVSKYLKMQGTGGYYGAKHADAITCASCGIRALNAGDDGKDFKEFCLNELNEFLMNDDDARDIDDALKNENLATIPTSSTGESIVINPYKVRSYYKHTNHDGIETYYHLHREFVDAAGLNNPAFAVCI